MDGGVDDDVEAVEGEEDCRRLALIEMVLSDLGEFVRVSREARGLAFFLLLVVFSGNIPLEHLVFFTLQLVPLVALARMLNWKTSLDF